MYLQSTKQMQKKTCSGNGQGWLSVRDKYTAQVTRWELGGGGERQEVRPEEKGN